jgi:hypothetical protein
MNLRLHRLSVDCPWTLRNVARPAGRGTARDERERVVALPEDGLAR